ncbi:MAG: ribonuclease P protein component [Candidatus Pacebacteria bacterium CG_4_10_14_3_um_filter_34_15]|nr:ribonuclease P protein component [Candidatus Pacearchaeota archaeon]NCQ65659.1 ribonuclease P protein component [Candidatus Paceibacterota bacterium]OIO43710.1 MAG: ribonuclease P protein component [Candidatus Pacebacteria bacterium CG1_02_43_31]PIQ80672.1 MAG: ribonuclease P protein component [Candidatus Pacebacteria bacterium CG11_big_fil_rev_8_21_14_0_20_34_55]PIX81984.1 MAG: ribonuclease P protein component [Candidatus Pacebacteria bacterium CG_4_10_14_3_um_filter_34_15]PJC43592.1 MAG: 
MLSKQFKLDLRSDKNFFYNCKKKHLQEFSVFYKKHTKDGLKIAIIVPKKTVKLATDRNRIKRIFYSVIEKLPEGIKNKNINVVIVVNKADIKEKDLNLIKTIEGSLVEITV